MTAPRSAGILPRLDNDGPDRSRARRLAQALMAAPGTIGPTDAHGTMALLPGAAKTVGARYGRGIMSMIEGLPAGLADMATLGPFRRLNNQIAAADATGTPRREAIDYGDVLGMTGYPAATGVTATAAGLVPRNSVGIFAGPLAKTADNAALSRAQALEKAGMHRDQIWQETGWGRGVDGQWRFEIDDSGAGISNYAWGEAAGRKGDMTGERMSLDAAIMHPELFKAYPHIGRQHAWIDESPGTVGAAGGDGIWAGGPDIATTRNTALHELEHMAQMQEGTAANQGSINRAARQAWPEKASELRKTVETKLPWWRQLTMTRQALKTHDKKKMDALSRQANELDELGHRHADVEELARAVEKRSRLTAAERRRRPFWYDFAIPEDQQIIPERTP